MASRANLYLMLLVFAGLLMFSSASSTDKIVEQNSNLQEFWTKFKASLRVTSGITSVITLFIFAWGFSCTEGSNQICISVRQLLGLSSIKIPDYNGIIWKIFGNN